MNSPSPLVPQGAIPPKTMSRSARVLVIGFSVVAVHVVGLSIFLLQGCKKDLTTADGAVGDTNAPSSAMSFPTLDAAGTNSYYTNAAALPTAAPSTGTVATAAPAYPTTATAPMTTGATSTVATAYPTTPTAPAPDSTFPSVPETTTAPAAAWTGTEYKIAKGDTLSGIAGRNGVTISAIQQANPGLDPRKLKIGQTIKVPAPTPRATPTATASAGSSGSSATTASGGGTYKVKAGDTLTRIAAKHGVTVNELRAANNMRTTRLLVGQTLNIPQRAARTAAANSTNTAQ